MVEFYTLIALTDFIVKYYDPKLGHNYGRFAC